MPREREPRRAVAVSEAGLNEVDAGVSPTVKEAPGVVPPPPRPRLRPPGTRRRHLRRRSWETGERLGPGDADSPALRSPDVQGPGGQVLRPRLKRGGSVVSLRSRAPDVAPSPPDLGSQFPVSVLSPLPDSSLTTLVSGAPRSPGPRLSYGRGAPVATEARASWPSGRRPQSPRP